MIPAILAIASLAIGIAVIKHDPLPPVVTSALPDPRVETLRAIIQRHTGWQIGDLQLQHGQWHALTAFGWKPVTDVLKEPRHPGVARFGEVIV